MPRRVSVLAAVVALAACHHAPPDLEARAVAPQPPPRRTPGPADLHGLWVSRTIRGALADLGTLAVYVFRPDGTYAGAIASDTTSTPLEGRYAYDDGVLDFDGGVLKMSASLVGDTLQLTSKDAYLELTRR